MPYRWEHNHVRPHEALNMKTPASVWQPSRRRYDPQPSHWEYPTGARVLKVDPQGRIEVNGRNWKISKALSGERVQVVKVEGRMMVFYCTTLMRELDLGTQRSTIVERWVPKRLHSRDVKDV